MASNHELSLAPWPSAASTNFALRQISRESCWNRESRRTLGLRHTLPYVVTRGLSMRSPTEEHRHPIVGKKLIPAPQSSRCFVFRCVPRFSFALPACLLFRVPVLIRDTNRTEREQTCCRGEGILHRRGVGRNRHHDTCPGGILWNSLPSSFSVPRGHNPG